MTDDDATSKADGEACAAREPAGPTHTDNGEGIPAGAAEFFAALFHADDFVLIRPMETWNEDGEKKSRPLYQATQHPTAKVLRTHALTWCNLLQTAERERANLFFGVCPRRGSNGFDLAWQIPLVRALYSDIDHCTVEEVLPRCEKAGLPRPSITVSSGNGVHAYWLLAEPYVITDGDARQVRKEWAIQEDGSRPPPRYYVHGSKKEKIYRQYRDEKTGAFSKRPNPDFPVLSEKARHAQDVLAGIAAAIGGDHTQDLCRLLRIPGTMNRKDQRNGKPPIPCALVEIDPERRYPFADFERFALQSPDRKKREAAAKVKLPRVRAWDRIAAAKRGAFEQKMEKCETAEDRSLADWNLICYAIERGISKADVWQRVAHVGKFAERGESYFETTWENASGHTREKIYDRQTNGRRANKQSGEPEADKQKRDADGRLEVEITTNESDVVEQVCAVLAADDSLFVRGGNLVRPLTIKQPPQKPDRTEGKLRVRYPPEMTFLRPANTPYVRLRITKHCRLIRLDAETDEYVPAHPPAWLAPGVEAAPGAIRPVANLLPGPTLDLSGQLINKAGYDPATCWFLSRDLPSLVLADNPGLDEARVAAKVLADLVQDFPFAEQVDRARWLCLLLTACCRQLIGRTPLGMLTANTAGSGKTFLARLISAVAHGLDEPILMSWPEGTEFMARGDEIRKRLASLLTEGASLVLIDNLPRGEDFGGPEIEAFLTSNAYSDRKLGQNDGVRVGGPNHCLVLATGNNVMPCGDTADRTLLVRLWTNNPNPRSRPQEEFHCPDLERHVLTERSRYLAAALTIWRAWIRADYPGPAGPGWGSFEDFVNGPVSIVRWLGLPDPIGDRLRQMNEMDHEVQALTAVLSLWTNVLGPEPIGCIAILGRLDPDAANPAQPSSSAWRELRQSFREAIQQLGRISRWPPSSPRLGKLLSGHRNRVVDVQSDQGRLRNLVLRSDYNSDVKAHRYFVEDAPANASTFTGGAGGSGGCYMPVPREGEEETAMYDAQGDRNGVCTWNPPEPPEPPVDGQTGREEFDL